MSLQLRKAVPADLETLVRYSDALNAEDGHPLQVPVRPVLEQLLADETLGAAFVIKRDGVAVGSVFMCFGFSIEFGGRDAIVDEIYIEPAARGMGIGDWVLKEMDAWARAHGLVALHLEVMADNPALRLYQRNGYADRQSVFMSKRFV
ncbi:MAG: GNAT family N-acetyltransferase [Pseudomonadota bacterium]